MPPLEGMAIATVPNTNVTNAAMTPCRPISDAVASNAYIDTQVSTK